MIPLNADQTVAVDRIVSGFLKENAPGYVVIGEGGTGKTTCIMTAAHRLLEGGLKVLFTAPTNKAVKQLEASARQFGLDSAKVEFATWHSALGLALLPNEENRHAAQIGKGILEDFDVVIGDEASMNSKILLTRHIMPRAEEANIKLVFMGDDMQLPPVKEEKSLAFDLFPQLRLTKVERQAEGSEILTVTGLLRTAIEGKKRFSHPEDVGGAVEVVQAAKFVEHVVDAFDKDTNLDEQRVLAWRNRRVDTINDAIRKKIYGRDAERFEIGERVVTGGPVSTGTGSSREILLSTDEECIVVAHRDSSIFDEVSGEDYKTTLLTLEPLHAKVRQVHTHILHESEETRYWERLEYLAKSAKAQPSKARQYWALYHKFKELFSNIRYCYCITIHRSQGSTYSKVFVDVADILANRIQKERQSLLYVAYSRPRHSLVINKRTYAA